MNLYFYIIWIFNIFSLTYSLNNSTSKEQSSLIRFGIDYDVLKLDRFEVVNEIFSLYTIHPSIDTKMIGIVIYSLFRNHITKQAHIYIYIYIYNIIIEVIDVFGWKEWHLIKSIASITNKLFIDNSDKIISLFSNQQQFKKFMSSIGNKDVI